MQCINFHLNDDVGMTRRPSTECYGNQPRKNFLTDETITDTVLTLRTIPVKVVAIKLCKVTRL